MTTLQEAALTALAFIRWNEFGECRTPGFQGPTPTAAEAADALEDALAQQGKQRPVAYITDTEQGPMVWTPEMYDEACTYCDDGEFPVPLYTAAPAPQPAQDVPEVGFGNIPTKFLANGTRFKLSFDMRGKVSSLWNFMDELDGRWVALVAAENDCHLQSAQPVAQPLSDSEIEKLREKTFSTYNPYCPVDSKSMRKAVRAAEAAHGIGEVK